MIYGDGSGDKNVNVPLAILLLVSASEEIILYRLKEI